MKYAAICPLFAALAFAQADPISTQVKARYAYAKQNLIESAEVMPEEHYEFRLSPAQRPWVEWLDHTTSMNYRMCASMQGQQPPSGTAPASRSKADQIAALKKSFEYCDAGFNSLADAKGAQPVTIGSRTVYPLNVAVDLLIQWNEHYGNMVGYMRSKGITPPTTARMQKKQ
jgi:hypothetical protein